MASFQGQALSRRFGWLDDRVGFSLIFCLFTVLCLFYARLSEGLDLDFQGLTWIVWGGWAGPCCNVGGILDVWVGVGARSCGTFSVFSKNINDDDDHVTVLSQSCVLSCIPVR